MATRGEEIEQAKFVKWTHRVKVRELMPGLAFLHHSPNGGRRDGLTGAQMKALGTKPGFPDLILPIADGAFVGLVIEMKSAEGRVTAEQREWLDLFNSQGWLTLVCRSAAEARESVCTYLGIALDQAPPLDT